jgi:glycosyltransferase involved in cell wall biosynthesis
MPPHPGGIERITSTLKDYYEQAGHEVAWVASRIPRQSARSEDDGRTRVRAWNPFERTIGVPWPLWGLDAFTELARHVRWANVVHVQDCLYTGSFMASWLARRYGRPMILSQHIGHIQYRSALLAGLVRFGYGTLGEWVVRNATRIVSVTPASDELIHDLLSESQRGCIVSIPTAVDVEVFRPAQENERMRLRSDLGIAPGTFTPLFVGRLVDRKGIDIVLGMARQRPAWQFIVVGEGPKGHDVDRASPNVIRVPNADRDTMARIYAAADCLLLPSHGEGLPLVVQEAMACALPVVATDSEAYVRWLAHHDVCLAAPATVEAMSRELALLAERATGKDLGRRARDFAVRNWSTDLVRELHLRVLQQVVPSVGERAAATVTPDSFHAP